MGEDATARIEEEKRSIYDEILKNESSPFFNHKDSELFFSAVAVGYYYKKKEPLKKKRDLFRTFTIGDKSKIWLLKAVAVSTSGIEVLKDIKEVVKICEEYANSGIDQIYKWHSEGIDICNNLSEIMLDIEQENTQES